MVINEICLKTLGDERGSLIAIEGEESIPFTIRRAYYIFDTKPGVERGLHAHKTLNQFAVAVSGSCEISLDDGQTDSVVLLDSPRKGILIGPGTWHTMRNFSRDCVLLVFADQHYDEGDYIRDYEEFKDLVNT